MPLQDFTENPGLSHDKIVLYLPTFRERDAYIAEQLKVEFRDIDGYRLIISAHPLFPKLKLRMNFHTAVISRLMI